MSVGKKKKSVKIEVEYDDHPEDIIEKFEAALNILGLTVEISTREGIPSIFVKISKE